MDYIYGNGGDDDIDGGSGIDTISYRYATRAVEVNLAAGTTAGADGNDTLSGVEYVLGSLYDDRIFGSSVDNYLAGNGGDDYFVNAGLDDDALFGGDDDDTLNGGEGGDYMDGDAGDDVYLVDAMDDRTIEAVGQGLDRVVSYVDWTLALNIEDLALIGAAVRRTGNALDNRVIGNSGDNVLDGGRGSDSVNGAAGTDVVVLTGLDGAGHDIIAYSAFVYALDRVDGSVDRIVNVESFSEFFVDGTSRAIEPAQINSFDARAYAASYDDLALAFRSDADAALSHYLNSGFFEGREITFDAAQYLANWTDLASAFGSDVAAARNRFLLSGVDEHRLAEDPLDYIASYADLTNAFAGLTLEQTRAAGLSHYQGGGWSEGRRNGIDFDVEQYLENNADVAAAFGGDDDLAAWHFINAGRNEGRMWEDPFEYIATFGDLIAAFGSGSEAEIRAAGLAHFRNASSAEQDARRAQIDLDADQYLANYEDLRAAFIDGQGGYDENQATLHFIRSGFSEGRTDDVLVA